MFLSPRGDLTTKAICPGSRISEGYVEPGKSHLLGQSSYHESSAEATLLPRGVPMEKSSDCQIHILYVLVSKRADAEFQPEKKQLMS